MKKEYCDTLLKYVDQAQLYADNLCKENIMPVQDHVKFTENTVIIRKQIESLVEKEPEPVEQ